MAAGHELSLTNAPLYVRRIIVKKLFGQYSYDLRLDGDASAGQSKLIIFYGDNGCGKTTVLKLIFHLLAHGSQSGHRAFVARTSFQSFTVELGNGISVTAQRPAEKLTGDFRMEIRQGAQVVSAATFISDDNGKVKSRRESPSDSPSVLEILGSGTV